jgi:uncharacterized protein (TIGR03067 family)
MNAHTLLPFLVALLLSAVCLADDSTRTPTGRVQDDYQLLEGEWRLVEEQLGKGIVGLTVARPDHIRIKGRVMTYQLGNRLPQERLLKIDPTRSPKWIDYQADWGLDVPRTSCGIYSLEGDRLRLCFGGEGRPSEFKPLPGGSVETWERVKR